MLSTKLFGFHSECVQHREEQVRHRRLLIEMQILILLEAELAATRQQDGIVIILMCAAVAAAVQDESPIEKIAIPFRCLFQSCQEASEILGEELIEAAQILARHLFCSHHEPNHASRLSDPARRGNFLARDGP